MIRNLHDKLNIPTEVLIQAYWFLTNFGIFFEFLGEFTPN
jgi:hypothetical protein